MVVKIVVMVVVNWVFVMFYYWGRCCVFINVGIKFKLRIVNRLILYIVIISEVMRDI